MRLCRRGFATLSASDAALERAFPRRVDLSVLEATETSFPTLDEVALKKAIADPMWDLLDRGGKRWRPELVSLLAECLRQDPASVVGIGAAVEVVHAASLVIDDVEDGGTLRRHKPCVHITHGTDIAINAATAAYFMVVPTIVAAATTTMQSSALLQVWASEMVALHYGQACDLVWHRGGLPYTPSTDHYYAMVAGKTGALARMAARMVCAVAVPEPPDAVRVALVRFAESIGVAFQIVDDVLDVSSAEFHAAKGFAGDISEGKLSLMVLLALHGAASAAQQQRLRDILAARTTDATLVREAVAILYECGAVSRARREAHTLMQSSWSAVATALADAPPAARDKLGAFTEKLVQRLV